MGWNHQLDKLQGLYKVFFYKRCLKLLPFVDSLPLRLCEVVESVPGITGFKVGSRDMFTKKQVR